MRRNQPGLMDTLCEIGTAAVVMLRNLHYMCFVVLGHVLVIGRWVIPVLVYVTIWGLAIYMAWSKAPEK